MARFRTSSPIALDLNGDGFKYTAVANSKVYFDIDADKYSERVEWIDANDGFLARDLNKNGKIDSQAELFGDNGGTRAYDKLKALDSNGNGKIDSGDKEFANLRIWQDLNGNGVTEAGELKTLAQHKIASISLQESAVKTYQGHAVDGTGSFIRTDGTKGAAADLLLATDQFDSWYTGDGTAASTNVDLETLFLPLSRGYGNLPSFHYAMTQNAAFKTLVQQFVALDAKTQFHTVYDKVQALLLEWAGASAVAPGAEGDNAKLAALLKLIDSKTGYNVDESFGMWMDAMLPRLLVQGPLSHIFTNAYYDFATDDVALRDTLANILTNAKANAPTDAAIKAVYWNEIARIIVDNADEFSLSAKDAQAQVDKTAGIKTFIAGVMGTTGNDHIRMNQEDKLVYGGRGNDTIYGNGYSDFLINSGDGVDEIRGGRSLLTGDAIDAGVVFGPGITYGALSFTFNGMASGLIVKVPGGGELRIPETDIVRFTFADGTVKTMQQVAADILAKKKTDGNDSISGFRFDDTIAGGLGNDTLDGHQGKNTYLVGKGEGNDVINSYWGEDTVQFGAGITFAALKLSNSASGILITLPGGGTVLTKDTEYFTFTDGTKKTLAQLQQAALTQAQTSGNDSIYGTAADDTITGGKGNDTIAGNGGKNVYVYNKGDGNDIINSYLGEDTLKFGAGITFDSLRFVQNQGYAPTITIADGSTIRTSDGQIEKLLFADGTSKTYKDMQETALRQAPTSGNDTIYIYDGWTGTLNSGAGNDAITAQRFGNQTIDGGAGADTIDGGWDIDTVTYANSPAAVTVNLTTNKNTGGDAAGDSLKGVENLIGSKYNDQLTGNQEANQLFGGTGNDTLYGATGNDTLDGGAGSDWLYGQAGADRLVGGAGNDIFVYSALADSQANGYDTITDFVRGQDHISLAGMGYTGIASGAAAGTKLGWVYDAAAKQTVVSAANGFKLALDGKLDLSASDFYFT